MNTAGSLDLSPAGELQTLLASRVALVVIESREEARVMELVREAALKAQRGKNWGVFQWTVTEGLLRVDVDLGGAQRTLAQPEQLLRHIRATTMAGIYVLLDFHPISTTRCSCARSRTSRRTTRSARARSCSSATR